MEQDSSALQTGAITESKAKLATSRRLEVDVRSRGAFELLELGEAIVSIRSDLRDLRLEKDDLRFERDRYKAAAADFQKKLVGALNDLDLARSFHEEAEQLRRDIVVLAKEFRERFVRDHNTAQLNSENRLRGTVASLKAAHEVELQKAVASLKAEHEVELRRTVESLGSEHELELRGEVIALAKEYKSKLTDKSLTPLKVRWWQ